MLSDLLSSEGPSDPVQLSPADAEAVLRVRGAHLEELFEVAPEGIVLVDMDDRVLRVNGEFLRMFGFEREEVLGRRINELIVPGHLAEEGEVVSRAGREGRSISLDTVRRRRDGTLLDVSLLGKPVHFERSSIAGYVIYRDITERKRAEEARDRAVAQRNRFYSTVSHELRTPLSGVMLYHDLLLGGAYGELTPAQREGVERAQHSAAHLLELVNDVLDLAKIESGRMEPHRESVALRDFLGGVLAAVHPLAAEHGCTLELRTGDAPTRVVTDSRILRQVLLNLVSNALKFGRGKPVRVECRELPDGEGICLEVSDQGSGISAADLPRIWEEFVQLGNGGAEGTGLGLAIARRLAGVLGGRLEAESVPGEGSTFRLRLPAHPPYL